ncbi:MAG: DinB family protein [Ignavibacteriaceae bacterium]|nr:DinB family protein [Ignavibacteriaceae bacterium]
MKSDELSRLLLSATEAAFHKLMVITEEESGKKSSPEKWSHKEILGHLIDSASNNHQRFVRAQFKSDLVFSGYQQDDWVKIQRYEDAPWLSLLNLWYEFNMHLGRIIAAIPGDIILLQRPSHNLDEIAWQPVAKAEPVTLAYFINDYIGHMQHHLKQIIY